MRQLLLVAGLFCLTSCAEDTIVVPSFDESAFLSNTSPLSQNARQLLEGVYTVETGAERFGSSVVLRSSGNYLSIFSGHNAGYFVLRTGSLDSVVFLEGYWRYQINTETGLALFRIPWNAGGKRLLADSSDNTPITIRGSIGSGTSSPSIPIVLRYWRPIRPEILSRPFWILAHRAGGRTSDYIPASENSVELIRIAERFGATGIEIDVRLTKDGVPVLYHDEFLNNRLTQKAPLVGPVEDYTLAQLKTFIRLIKGERIPTLREALETVLTETTLRFVWLDSKTEDRSLLTVVRPIQQEFLQRAQVMGRQLEIVIGLPTEGVLNEFLTLSSSQTTPSVCELSLDETRRANSTVWAPRWTLGTLDADAAAMHVEGRRAFVWTLDVQEFIQQFIERGTYDGILTNYPMLVAYHHYVR